MQTKEELLAILRNQPKQETPAKPEIVKCHDKKCIMECWHRVPHEKSNLCKSHGYCPECKK